MLLLFFGLFLIPAFASAMDKVVVIPFMVKSTESEENLNITLQKWFSTEMSALGYEVSNPELVIMPLVKISPTQSLKSR
jgi:hypothetical protein